MLRTWHCPHAPAVTAAHRQCSNRSISPARWAHSSKPAAAAGQDRTHRRTDTRQFQKGIRCNSAKKCTALPTFAEVCINAHITSSSCQAFMLAVRNVFITVGIDVLLGEAKVYDEYCVPLGARRAADEKILRLDITINQQLGMHVLHTLKLQQQSTVFTVQ